MKTNADKSSSTTSKTATQATVRPFFTKAGEGNFLAGSVQARMTVGKTGDAFEKEADTVAYQVVNRAEVAPPGMQNKSAGREEKDRLRLQPLAESITPFVQRQETAPFQKAEAEDDEAQAVPLQRQAKENKTDREKLFQKAKGDKPVVQLKTADQSLLILNTATKNRLMETKGQGSPLPGSVKNFMEAGFGIDFSHVRIHTGGSAARLSKELHAQAFTQGSDIYFNEGKYNPADTDDQKLLAHELTHVVQQNKSKGVPLKPASRKTVGKNAIEPLDAVPAPIPPSSQPDDSSAATHAPTVASAVPQATSPVKTPASPPDRTETSEGLPGEKEGTPDEELSAIEPAKAPARPEEDPDFQESKKSIRNDARKQKGHETAAKKQAEMRAAAALPPKDQMEQSGQEQKAAALEEAAKPKKRFDRVSFKEKLKSKIDEKLPKTEDEAKAFPSSGKLDEAKTEFGQTVGEEKGQVTGPLEISAKTPPPPGQVTKKETKLPDPRPADRPSKIPSRLAAPKSRTDREISLQHESDNLDKRMAQGNITEKQLAESEEPKFEQALKKKQDAQREIAAAPARFREQEAQVLKQARQHADMNTGRKLQAMANVKNKSLGNDGVHGSQTRKESQTEIRQREIKNTINDIYSRTESDVKTILDNLSIAVQNRFNVEAQMANMFFNMAVRSRLDDYYGWFTFDDKIAEWAGLSDGVAHIFLEEKQNFLDRMDKVLDGIATTVETELNRALDRIQQGRTSLDNFKKTLSTDEQTFADDLIKEVKDKFKDLEASVEEQQEELLDALSDQYVENVNKLQGEFDKINEELGSSWIAGAINFIKDVANAIRKLGALLKSIVERIADQVDAILAAPKKFFSTLVSGINQGLDKFTSNIGTYLEQGFWMWLTGASSARNIQIPEKMDPKGMFSLALQIIGIDKQFFLERIRVKLGKGVEKLITGAQAAGEKLLEPVRILLDGGVGALWDWVKEEVSSHLQEIFAKIKEEIFEAIIKKALLWVASLFIPGLGFIRLIQAIYKALRWLVDNINRIADMVNSFLDSIALAVKGNVGAIADKVIKGLTLGVVIAIDFLAKLVGLGNFADKLHRAIQSLKKPIQKVVDWLLTKARPVVRKLKLALQKVAKGIKKKAAAVKEKISAWWKARKQFKDSDGQTHQLYFSGLGKSAKLQVASTDPAQVKEFLDTIKADVPKDKMSVWNSAKSLNEIIEGLQDKLEKSNENVSSRVKSNQAAYETLNSNMENLGAKLGILMSYAKSEEPPPPILPSFSNNVRATSVEASYLTASASFPKGESSDRHSGNLGGWAELQDSGVRERDNFVKMHLLHHKLGGKATDSNLTPAKSTINSEYYRDIEAPALRDSGLMAGRKKKSNKIIWFKVDVGYHGGNAFQQNFINSIKASYGYHEKEKNWAKNSPAISPWGASPGVPDLKMKIYAINEDGKTALYQMKYQKDKKFSGEFIDLLVLEKKEPFGKEKKAKYSSSADVEKRLTNRLELEKGWNKKKMEKETTLLVEAIENPTVNIKLNGAD